MSETGAERLTRTKAAEIARARGLSMSDAAALCQLADTVTEAETIASTFADVNIDYDKLAADIHGKGLS
jgi:hypothetical protein